MAKSDIQNGAFLNEEDEAREALEATRSPRSPVLPPLWQSGSEK